jgi:hypothetical protein
MEFVYLFSSATTGSCRDQFARCSSISSQVSIITNNLVPRNCVWWQRPNAGPVFRLLKTNRRVTWLGKSPRIPA